MPALVLSGGTILTVNADDELIAAGDLRVEGSLIAALGPAGTLAAPGDTVIDCRDTLITPGLVNVHTHAGAALLRGVVEDAPRAFWHAGYAVPRQERLGADDYVLSARAACAEFLLNGVTTIADRFSGMERIGAAIAESRIRAAVGETLRGTATTRDWYAAEAVIERFGVDPAASRVFAGIAPHALDSCGDDLLRECARRAERLGAAVFVHVAQSAPEIAAVKARGHTGALACLEACGLVGGHVVAAHCIYLEEAELARWPQSGIAIAHCPASNLKIEARTLPLHRLLGRVPIGLGTDWTASDNAMDLLAEARIAALVGKLLADDPEALPVRSMMRMLTVDGARVLGIDHLVGSIEQDKRADLVVFDLRQLEANPRHDLAANLVYSMSTRAVRDVMVDGDLLVRDFRLTWADAEVVARSHERVAAKLRSAGRSDRL
ncbi:MAG TPA: amidohydrolase family protein [Stellaceae bacterium]|nr:amidohydrolase family protein [Stellaceae bacterium]